MSEKFPQLSGLVPTTNNPLSFGVSYSDLANYTGSSYLTTNNSVSNVSTFDTKMNIVSQRIGELRNPLSPSEHLLVENAKESIEEKFFNATANVKIMTSQVAMHLDKEWRNKLFAQLDSLHDLAEWDEDDEPIKQASFATFLKAILLLRPQRRPGLGLTHTGFLIATWTKGVNRLTIEFQPNNKVQWVISKKHKGETERYAGQTSVSRLSEGLQPYSPQEWFSV